MLLREDERIADRNEAPPLFLSLKTAFKSTNGISVFLLICMLPRLCPKKRQRRWQGMKNLSKLINSIGKLQVEPHVQRVILVH